MKTAITSTGSTLKDRLDNHFGRCPWFIIFDDETGGIEILPNPNLRKIENAGPASVELLVSKGVSKVVAGEFGFKVKELFDRHKIQLIMVRKKMTIEDIINLLSKQKN